MKLSYAQNIRTSVNDETLDDLFDALEDEFKTVSASTKVFEDCLEVTQINGSFGAALRNDITIITIEENRKGDGYVINCETVYKPSIWFWVWCVIDWVLSAFIIGIVFFFITIGLYFNNRSQVENAIRNALDRVRQDFE